MNQPPKPRVDRTAVFIDDPYQRGYWMAKWDISEVTLRAAVLAVGNEPAALMQFLNVPGHHIAKMRSFTSYNMPNAYPRNKVLAVNNADPPRRKR